MAPDGPSRRPNGLNRRRDFAVSREEYIFDDDDLDEVVDNQEGNMADTAPPDLDDQQYERLMTTAEEVDYYSLLGLPRNPPPTDAQIRSAYHALSLSLHPDKQPASLRDIANEQYARIQNAYDTLIDPQKRVVYDMLGEDGVRMEWGIGGSMSRGREAQQQQIGMRAMTADEFRQWFIEIMKGRERKELEAMVESKGSVIVGLDATSWFESEDSTTSETPSTWTVPYIKASSYHVKYSFKAPLPWLKSLWKSSTTHEDAMSEDVQSSGNDKASASAYEPQPELIIHTSIGGNLQRLRRKLQFVDEKTGEKEIKEVELPRSIFTRAFSLGTSVHYSAPESISTDGKKAGFILALFRGSAIEVGGVLLPRPVLRTAISRSVIPVSGARALIVRLQATCHNPISLVPPIVDISLQRQIGLSQYIFASWNSGASLWPDFVSRFLAPLVDVGVNPDAPLTLSGGASRFAIGYSSLAGYIAPTGDSKEAEDASEIPQLPIKSNAGESWGFELEASPNGSALSVSYGRNVFRGTVDPPMRSQWSAEGKHNRHSGTSLARESQAVRLDLQSSIGNDLSISWLVRGSRKFGDFTRMGLAVGVQGPRGLVLSITWSRLGQTINLPIAVCPIEFVDPDVIALAISLPWVAYGLIEYGLVRPIARRKRRNAVAKRREHLKKHTAKRRMESFQAIQLMTDHVNRRQAKEAERGGLVIVKAEYGEASSTRRRRASSGSSENLIDVTIPMAALVDQSQLVIPRQVNKSQMLGCYDPAPLAAKVLRVRYLFANEEHFVEVKDDQDLVCPMKSHLAPPV